jgi:hypothetical protein
VARGIISFPREPNLIEAGGRGERQRIKLSSDKTPFFGRGTGARAKRISTFFFLRLLFVLQSLTIKIHQQKGDKYEWFTSDTARG